MKGEEKIEDVCMREICVCVQTNMFYWLENWLHFDIWSFETVNYILCEKTD